MFRVALALILTALPGGAQTLPDTPYALYYAEVVRVIDGDTLDVRVSLWPGLEAVYAVRVRGVDAPELRRVGCAAERIWGEKAKAQVERLYPPGTTLLAASSPMCAAGAPTAGSISPMNWWSGDWPSPGRLTWPMSRGACSPKPAEGFRRADSDSMVNPARSAQRRDGRKTGPRRFPDRVSARTPAD